MRKITLGKFTGNVVRTLQTAFLHTRTHARVCVCMYCTTTSTLVVQTIAELEVHEAESREVFVPAAASPLMAKGGGGFLLLLASRHAHNGFRYGDGCGGPAQTSPGFFASEVRHLMIAIRTYVRCTTYVPHRQKLRLDSCTRCGGGVVSVLHIEGNLPAFEWKYGKMMTAAAPTTAFSL